MKQQTAEEKKKLILQLYTWDEILEIMGYNEGVGSTAWDEATQLKLESIEETHPLEFEGIVLDEAIVNGNFEEPLRLGKRTAI